MIQESSWNRQSETAASACDRTQEGDSHPSLKEQAHKLAEAVPHNMEEAKEKAGQAMNRLTESFHETSHKAKEQAGEASRRLKEQGQNLAEQQRGRVADEIATFGAAAHRAADKFDEQDDRNIAGYVHAAGEQIDRIAGYVRDKDLNQLLDDAAHLARRRPEVFFGGMFVAGLALARFLKASGRPSRQQTSSLGTEMHHEGDIRSTSQQAQSPLTMETQRREPTPTDELQQIAPPLGPDRFSTDTSPAPNVAAGSVITSENTLRPAEREPFALSGQEHETRPAGSPLLDSRGEPVSSTQPAHEAGPHCGSETSARDEDRPTCC